MNVTLTPAQEAIVRRLIDSGRCTTEAEAIDVALRQLDEDERLYQDIRRKVREGIVQAERGDLLDAEDVFARLKREHEEQFGVQTWRGPSRSR